MFFAITTKKYLKYSGQTSSFCHRIFGRGVPRALARNCAIIVTNHISPGLNLNSNLLTILAYCYPDEMSSVYLDSVMERVNSLGGWAEDEIGGDVHTRGVDYKSIRWNA